MTQRMQTILIRMSTSNIIKHIIDNDIDIDIKKYDDNDINIRKNRHQNTVYYTPVINNNNNNVHDVIRNDDIENNNIDSVEVYDKEDHNKVNF